MPSGAAMLIENWPITRPIPYAKNARIHSARAIEVVASSIKEFGWRQPIVVDKDDVIVMGHTRLLAAQRLGLTEVPVHVASNLTPAQIKALRLADNRTHEESTWDWDLLGPELGELKELGLDLKLTAFTKDDAQKAFLSDWDEEELEQLDAPLSVVEYSVVVDCKDEAQQTELLARFEAEGLQAHALVS
jgi:hypothetical protein